MAQLRSKYSQAGLKFKDGSTTIHDVNNIDNGGSKIPTVAYAADGAIPLYSHTAVLTKAGVNAMTLAVPTATTHDGVTITVMSTTANAHTVTATTVGFNAGDAASDVATFGAAIGNSFSFVAYQGEWYVMNTPDGVTLG